MQVLQPRIDDGTLAAKTVDIINSLKAGEGMTAADAMANNEVLASNPNRLELLK